MKAKIQSQFIFSVLNNYEQLYQSNALADCTFILLKREMVRNCQFIIFSVYFFNFWDFVHVSVLLCAADTVTLV